MISLQYKFLNPAKCEHKSAIRAHKIREKFWKFRKIFFVKKLDRTIPMGLHETAIESNESQ